MCYLEYREIRRAKEQESGKALTSADRDQISGELAGRGGASDKSLKHCLQSELVLRYWESLASVAGGEHFFNTKYFSSEWSDKTIHQPGGGVSNIICFFSGSLTNGGCSSLWRSSLRLPISLDCCLHHVSFMWTR